MSLLHELHRLYTDRGHTHQQVDHLFLVIGKAIGIELLRNGEVFGFLLFVAFENPFQRRIGAKVQLPSEIWQVVLRLPKAFVPSPLWGLLRYNGNILQPSLFRQNSVVSSREYTGMVPNPAHQYAWAAVCCFSGRRTSSIRPPVGPWRFVWLTQHLEPSLS